MSTSRSTGTSWSWRYEKADGAPAESSLGPSPTFPNQADAESWVGETWRELLESGVDAVVLLDGDREVYGPMGLSAS